ncbi:diguanylate cyclase [Halomonas sp. HNIBRBA4712]|uniref:diguanylate cyclase n=1 Tax=Halomonas sp. HNIBRBA4712 TaxID=3373087 RepID=UPI003746F0ED
MLSLIRKTWSPGVAGNSVAVRRKIELCNQLGLFGVIMSAIYQALYVVSGLDLSSPFFTLNFCHLAVYASILWMNHWRWYLAARLCFTLAVMTQLLVGSFYLSVDTGLHLFYITLAGALTFLFPRHQWYLSNGLALLSIVLFVLVSLLFSSGMGATPLPGFWNNMLHGLSVAAVLMVLGTLLYLYRNQFEKSEQELVINNQALEMLGNTDALTGLANRRVLDETLKREWQRLARQPGALSIIMCDIDHFKNYNDRFGHDGGDRCLQRVALVLQAELARPADLIVRYGGEEFALVLPETDERGARYLGNRLCEAVRRLEIPNPGVGNGLVTASVGISSIHALDYSDLSPEGGESLLRCADKALYQAKSRGRDQAAFQPYPAGKQGLRSVDSAR